MNDQVTAFNSAIVKGMGDTNADTEMQNYIATTFGRHMAGVAVYQANLPQCCPECGQPDAPNGAGVIAKRRLNTAYVDDNKNWYISCVTRFDNLCDWVAEMWAEYYANCY